MPTLNVERVRWDTRNSVGEVLDETRILLGVILSARGLKRPVIVSTLRSTSRYLPTRGNEAERCPSSFDRRIIVRRAPEPPTGMAWSVLLTGTITWVQIGASSSEYRSQGVIACTSPVTRAWAAPPVMNVNVAAVVVITLSTR